MTGNVQELLLRINADTRKLNAALGTSQQKVGGFSSSLKSLKGSFLAIAAVVATVVYAFKKFIDMTADFERQFANVSTLLDLTEEEFKSLRSGVLNLAGGIGSATEMTKGLYQTISAGITDPANALKFLETAGRAAAAGLATTFEAVDLGTSVLNAFALESDQAGKIFDQVQATIRLGKTTFGELASTVGRAAPIFKEAGLKSEELLASIAALTKQGISTDIAVTGLRQAVVQIIKPTEEAQEIWEKYGIKNAAAMLASQGLAKTLKFVKEKVGDNNTELTKLFGNVRAYTAVAPLASSASEDFADALDQVTNSRGELDKAFGKVEETFEYQMKEVIEKLRSAIVNELLPALTDFAKWLNDHQGDFDNWIQGLKDYVDAIKELYAFYDKYLTPINEKLDTYNKTLDAINKAHAFYTEKLKVVQQGSKELREEFAKLLRFGQTHLQAIDTLMKRHDKLGTEIRTTVLATKDSTKATKENTKATKEGGKSYKTQKGQLSKTTLALYRYQDAIKNGVMPAYKDLLVAMKHFSLSLTIQEQEMENWSKDLIKYMEDPLNKMAEIKDYDFGMPEPPSPDYWNRYLGNFKSAWNSLKDQFGFGQGGGLLGNLIGSDLTKGGGILGMVGRFAGPQGGIVGMLQSVTSMIPGIGTAISGIIGGIAVAFKGLKKLFGGLSTEAKVTKEVIRDLGVEISESLAKKIAEASEEIGDRFTAITLHLGDIMQETDLTADNFDTFAARARDIFSLLETGMISSAQATSTLNDVFGQLAEKSEELGITYNQNMVDMIRLSRQFGLEVESIAEYVDEKLGEAISGLTRATQNLGEIGQAAFDRLARAASAVFQAMLDGGADVGDAISRLKDIINALTQAQEENGLKGSAALNQLKRYANLVETNQAVIESVKGMEQVYTSLAQVGAMNQKLFNDWQEETIDNYKKLIAGGFKQNESLAMMAPTLQALKDAHENMGLKLDENTKKLIEQAEAMGLLKEDPIERIADAVERLVEKMERLIDYMAGHSPPGGSLIEALDSVTKRMYGFGRAVENSFVTDPIYALINAINEVPKNINVNVGYTYDEYQGDGGGGGGGGNNVPAMQHGGVFTRPTLAMIGENPRMNPEFLLNRPQMESLLASRGITIAKGAIVINSSTGDPTEIANAVFDKLTQKLRYNRRGL